jgi:transcriptional regulator with XRE-family HTH domain
MLNERIRTLRLAKGLTLQAVADVFGISRASVSSWESGTNQPDPRKLEKLAELFNATVEYLITGNSTSDHEGLNTLGLLVPFIEWTNLPLQKSYTPKHFIPAWYSEPSPNAFATRLFVSDSFNWTPGPIPAGAIVIVDPMAKPNHGKFVLAKDKEGQIGFGEISNTRGSEVITFFNNRTTINLTKSSSILGTLTEWRLSGKL